MRRLQSAILTIVAGLTAVSTARADLPIPGQRQIDHTFEIIGLERAPEGTKFIVGPMHLGMGHEVVGPGVRFTYRSKYASPNLYAVTEVPEKFDFKALDASDTPRAVRPFTVTNRVPTGSPVERMHSVHEFHGIDGKTIDLRHVWTSATDRQGTEVSDSGWSWPPMLVSLVALAGLLVMAFRLRRRQPEAAEE
jgi:hypothetical protein